MTTPRFPRRFGQSAGRRIERSSQAVVSAGSAIPESTKAEVILSCDGDLLHGADPRTVRSARARGVFVPESYEPNYAYPLVVWLHESGGSERDIAEVFPLISMRNYLGLSLRGSRFLEADETRYTWSHSDRARAALEEELHASVRYLRGKYHVNGERIFLAGAGEGGTMAWSLFLSRPEWFAGLAVLGSRFPWDSRPLRRFRALRGKRLYVAAEAEDSAAVAQSEAVGRLMYTAGLEVAVRCHARGRRTSKPVLRSVDGWIMESIGGCG